MTRLRPDSAPRASSRSRRSASREGGQRLRRASPRDVSAANAYTTALTLVARREISAASLRTRLLRRGFAADDVDEIVTRLTRDGTIDDRRTAAAAARLEGAIRLRGRRRVLQKVRALGIDADVAHAAVDSVFADVDETALLDRAIAKRLNGKDVSTLDRPATARLVRSLVGQGFDASHVFKRLRTRDDD